MLKYILLVVSFLWCAEIFPQVPLVQQILDDVNQDSLIFFVSELSGEVPTTINGTSQTIISRNKYQPGNSLAETYIEQKLVSYGLSTTVQSFSATGNNVFAVQPGSEYSNQYYIICAHYDDMPSGTIAPGADDNASGTAAVIEAARIFSQYSFPYTIVYALWDEEEQGLIGSEYYAGQAAAAGDSILGVLNMDMISYDSDDDGIANIHSRPTAGNSDEIKDIMVDCNSLYGIDLSLIIKSPGSTYSDHASFWSHNYGAILLIEDENDFHPYYHTVNDLLIYYNQPYYVRSAKLVYAALASLALDLNMSIDHIPVASVSESIPVNADARVSTGLVIGSGNLAPRLYFRTKVSGGTFGSFTGITGDPLESGDYNFTIPAQPLGTIVQYYLAAQDENSTIVTTLPEGGGGYDPPGNIPPAEFFQFYFSSQMVVMEDEADNLDNWSSVGGWDITSSRYVSPPTSFTDSPGGDYSNNVTATLTCSSTIDLSEAFGALLEFDTQWAIEDDWDYGQVQVSTDNGVTWMSLEGQYTNPGVGSFQPSGEPLYDGVQLDWVHENIDISDFIGENINLRFILKTDTYVTADGWYLDNIKVTAFGDATAFQFSVNILGGWNMVSVPGTNPDGQDVDTWWPGRVQSTQVYKYSGSFLPVTTTTQGEGYWMKNNGDQTYNTGDEWPAEGIETVAHNPIAAAAGWNMIGGYELSVSTDGLTTDPEGLITGTIYEYNGAYQPAATIVPGYGYWIKLTGEGNIIIPDPVCKEVNKVTVERFRDTRGNIILTDGAGKSFTLYAVNGEVDLNQYELPPPPPSGMFDVRYGSGRIAENISSKMQIIEMRGMTYPVEVKVVGINIRLQDVGGKEINVILKPGEEIIISNSGIQKLMVSEETIPVKYSLEQNYPNPFNPLTTINFSLPEASEVMLTIYNTLGQKITRLVNGKLESGRYSYQWNAKNFSSGTYLYELRTEKFISIKKMLLLK